MPSRLSMLIMWVYILLAPVDDNFFVSILDVNKLLRKVVTAIDSIYVAGLFLRVLKGVLKWKLIIYGVLLLHKVSGKGFLRDSLIRLFLTSINIRRFNDVLVPSLGGELFVGASLACWYIFISIVLKGLESNSWVNFGFLVSWRNTVEVKWSLTETFVFL